LLCCAFEFEAGRLLITIIFLSQKLQQKGESITGSHHMQGTLFAT
jgi:hypothetical protein